MTATLIAALLATTASLALRAGARRAVIGARPQRAVRLLTGGSFAVTLALGLTLCAVGLAVAGRTAPVAALGQWSATVLTILVPVPAWLGIAAGIAAIGLGGSALLRSARIIMALTRAEAISRRLRRGHSPLVLLHDDTLDAYTVAGIRGCVVIGTGLYDRLDTVERRVLLAHELSHLNRRHHLYLHAADLAAAANPLLRAVPDIIRLGVERWADEDAVTAIDGDRRTVALTLAKVARIKTNAATPRQPAISLAAARSHLAERASALLTPHNQARRQTLLLIGVAVTIAAMLTSTLSATQIHTRMEIAQLALNSVRETVIPDTA